MIKTSMDSRLLKAFNGKTDVPPVWLMRQAGRYIPQYRKIREKLRFVEMMKNPDVVCEVTVMPVDMLSVDAAILFADILTLPMAMGFDIDFVEGKGPIVGNPVASMKDVERIRGYDDLSHVEKSIHLVLESLPRDIPLIGFAGAPFTVLVYLVEGSSPKGLGKLMRLISQDEKTFHGLMEVLTVNTINYLNMQKDAGVHLFQLFDSWGGLLRAEDFGRLVFPYNQRIFDAVSLPSIYYLRGSAHLMEWMDRTHADFLSVCHTVSFDDNKVLSKTNKGVQGNLYNGLLYGDTETLSREIDKLLHSAKKFKKYIFNLNHGILPDIDVEKVRYLVERVRAYPWDKMS